MKIEIKTQIEELVDALETEYGDIEGFECKLNHPNKKGEKQIFADIKQFNIYTITKYNLWKCNKINIE